jgi:hypothetical protein
MTDWTAVRVEERLVEAVSVLRRLPPVRVGGYFSTWPPTLLELGDLVAQVPWHMALPPPSAASIDRMDAALPWLAWLEPLDAKIVWRRASGERWKSICLSVGLSRAAADEHRRYGLCVIAWRLNGHDGPKRTGKRRFVDRARRARSLAGVPSVR